MLWTVGSSVLLLNVIRRAVLRELDVGELATPISLERPPIVPRLAIRLRLDLLDSSDCMILRIDRSHPHVSNEVIHQQFLVVPWHRWHDGTAQVTMHQLQELSRMILCLRREGGVPLLARLASVAHPLHLTELRQPSN